MKSIAIVIASLAAMLALTACAGVRAEVGAIPTDAPPAPVPTPQVIVIREPAPAPADTGVNIYTAGGLLIAGAGLGMGIASLIIALVIVRHKRAPERSQLNEAPTYLPPAVAERSVLTLPDEWDKWSAYRKEEFLRGNGFAPRAIAQILNSEPAKLPPPRR